MRRLATPFLVTSGIFFFLAGTLHRILRAGDSPELTAGIIDQYSQFLPFLASAKRSFLAGSFPLWNPYQALGRPLFAQMGSGLLYPINWIILLMDEPNAMLAIQVMPTAIGMVGIILFLRYLELKWVGIIPAATLMGYSVFKESFLLPLSSLRCS